MHKLENRFWQNCGYYGEKLHFPSAFWHFLLYSLALVFRKCAEDIRLRDDERRGKKDMPSEVNNEAWQRCTALAKCEEGKDMDCTAIPLELLGGRESAKCAKRNDDAKSEKRLLLALTYSGKLA